jgi:uncharacterized Zn finger protein
MGDYVEKCVFLIKGSASEPYKVTFEKDGSNLSAYCTCPAGQNGQYCKHRFAILAGDVDTVVSENVVDAKKVAGWLPGTDAESALQDVTIAEKELARAKKKLSAAKRRLAVTFRN